MSQSPLHSAYTRICLSCKTLETVFLTEEIVRLDFSWGGPAPRAGQFFMIKPKRSSVFLPRPLSVARWEPAKSPNSKTMILSFLVALRGRGTLELSQLGTGEEVEVTGPLGNAWADFPPPGVGGPGKPDAGAGRAATDAGMGKPWALMGGGVGIAPLLALAEELSGDRAAPEAGKNFYGFDFYGGFKKPWPDLRTREGLTGAARGARRLILAFEDSGAGQDSGDGPASKGRPGSKNGQSSGGTPEHPETGPLPAIYRGRIPDFFNPRDYAVVYACGPEPMLRTLGVRCRALGIPCYLSMERRMACGVGACLGCTVETRGGNRRCCTDGPIFPAEELYLDE
ncbi:MAG: dihydroorotate dehydrogenase electron transfer subunit [Spirochaetaceae bacterium]|jgi:NAD(P)H-flavin reductase|nr:dihydroorotate dehydrogenase electron transfer subunit [Spirochaetaceae bacterium]